MNKNKGNGKMSSKNKYAFYTLGLGLVLLGATQVSPAQTVIEKNSQEDQQAVIEETQSTTKTTKSTSVRKAAINSLSSKNKAAFHTLSESDQKKVVEAYKNGKGAQYGIIEVLNEDANEYQENGGSLAPSENQNSPASKSMRKNQQNTYD